MDLFRILFFSFFLQTISLIESFVVLYHFHVDGQQVNFYCNPNQINGIKIRTACIVGKIIRNQQDIVSLGGNKQTPTFHRLFTCFYFRQCYYSKTTFKHPGVILDSDFSLKSYINWTVNIEFFSPETTQISPKRHSHRANKTTTPHLRSLTPRLCTVNAFIDILSLNFNDSLPKYQTDKRQSMFNAAARHITGFHTWDV